MGHTRFSHSLGCWLLSEWAANNVFVERRVREKKGVKGKKGKDGSSSTPTEFERLGTRLRRVGYLEEFQLALLLHDIGHFPFSHVIENNDLLRARYANQDETAGIALNHEAIGCGLIEGQGNAVFELFKECMLDRCGRVDEDRFLSSRLANFKKVETDKITHLLDASNRPISGSSGTGGKGFLRCVHELVSGVIDLDRIDHYHRDNYFISVKGGEFNIRGLLNHMAIVQSGDSAGMRIQLVGDGVGHAFQMLYAKTTLTQSVFTNVYNLGYEVMINAAINEHWASASPEFRKFLPFLNDSELLHELLGSEVEAARRITQRVQLCDPFVCAGKHFVSEKLYAGLGSTKAERRETFTKSFRQHMKVRDLDEKECFLRFDKQFGKSPSETDWMDLKEILGDDGRPLEKNEEHGKFVDFIQQREKVAARTFWLFVADDSRLEAATSLGKHLSSES